MAGQRDILPSVPGFKVRDELGQGSYGAVYRVRRLEDGQNYAVKVIKIEEMPIGDAELCVNEARVLNAVKHINIIGFYGAFLQDGKLYIVMEFAPRKTVGYYISKGQRLQAKAAGFRFTEEIVWRVLLQMARGLAALHHQQIIHRDIKPANVLMCDDDVLKIADLGIARVLTRMPAQTSIGSFPYMAPEVWSHQPYSYSCDMWSLGCVMYEMMTLRPAFRARERHELFELVRAGRFQPIPAGTYSPELVAIVHSLLSVNPAHRPTAAQILSHDSSKQWLWVLPRLTASDPGGSVQPRHPAGAGHLAPALLTTLRLPCDPCNPNHVDIRKVSQVLPPPRFDQHHEDAQEAQPGPRGVHAPAGQPTPSAACQAAPPRQQQLLQQQVVLPGPSASRQAAASGIGSVAALALGVPNAAWRQHVYPVDRRGEQ